MKIAAIYLRVSTADQAAEGKSSLDTQRRECLAMAAAHGFEVPSNLIFQDVISGIRDDRPQFMAMLAKAKSNDFTHLYAMSVDRIGRVMRDTVNAVEDLKKMGISTWTKQGDLSNPLVFAVFSAVAEIEHGQIRARTLPAKLARRNAGFWVNGRPPFGYRMTPQKTLQVCPDEALIVRRIFAECVNGLGRTAIARGLNVDQVSPPEMKEIGPTGRKKRLRIAHSPDSTIKHIGSIARAQWQSRSIARILSNTMAYGESNGRRYKIEPSPILTKPQYDAARRAMSARYRKGKSSAGRWLLTGLMKCTCGANYRHHQGRGNYHSYVCNAARSGKQCLNPPIKMEDADRAAINAASALLLVQSSEMVETVLFGLTRAKASEIKNNLDEKEAEHELAVKLHEDASEDFIAARQAKVDAKHLYLLGGRITAAGKDVERIGLEIDRLNSELSQISSSDNFTDAELASIHRELIRSFQLRSISYDESGKVDEVEDIPDIRLVVRTLVRQAMVNSDKTITIQLFDTAENPERLRQLLSQLALREMDFIKSARISTNPLASIRASESDIPLVEK